MKLIRISTIKYGEVYAKIDDEDFELVSNYKWYLKKSKTNSYAVAHKYLGKIGEKGNRRSLWKTIYMHSLIMKTVDTEFQVDHKDMDGLNNIRNNLRKCTQADNVCNKKAYGTSKYLGVYKAHFRKYKSRATYVRFVCEILKGRKKYCIGRFECEEDAAIAYDFFAYMIHGEFARLNFPELFC